MASSGDGDQQDDDAAGYGKGRKEQSNGHGKADLVLREAMARRVQLVVGVAMGSSGKRRSQSRRRRSQSSFLGRWMARADEALGCSLHTSHRLKVDHCLGS